ncbi:MAG: lamin tail domain-containing protein [Nanoarchaeota archaeon]|nr:lamin tail domain-containing protein [Nanoarchaeota archaeon]MBU1322080.1 lamin tail domain-containing protein [Nanoarchaeota archaeon]MBU2441316.1 lamin tail domain-containing protein [Nanoarchaeota archaeon]
MKKIALLLLICLSAQLVWGININEIMYNPSGSDNNKEFVEIFGTDNLTGYTIGDLASNDTLELIKFFQGNFSLIVEEGFNHTNINCSIYNAGATIGNNLNNGEDTVFLYYNNILIDMIGYDGSLANNNDYSLELINGTWQESCELGGSPGKENCLIINENINNESINISINESENENINETINETIDEPEPIIQNETINNQTEENITNPTLKIEIIISENLFLGVTYTSLFKITNLNHVSGGENYVNVSVKYNVTKNDVLNNTLIKEDVFNKTINYYSSSNTGKLFIEETGNYTLCGTIINTTISVCKNFTVINPSQISCNISINLSTDKEIYLNNEKVKIYNIINNKTYPYIFEYWIEDLFGNDVKKRTNTSNTNQKTWTAKIVEKDRVFLVKNKLVFVGCNNSNININSENEKMIIVKKQESNIGKDDDSDSSISIDYIYLPKSEVFAFGDNFNVKLSIHKGDTTKSLIKAFVEKNNRKVSEEVKFYLNKKDSDYNLTVNVILKPNCGIGETESNYDLVVEGLGLEMTEKIMIKGNKKGLCEENKPELKGEISSFYTRSKKYSKEINLYASIKGTGITEVYEATLFSKKGKQNKIIQDSDKLQFVVEPEIGVNLFFLELKKEGEIIDTQTLLVELEGTEEKKNISHTVLLEKPNMIEEKENNLTNYSLATITGMTVYESDNVKMIKYLPYFFIFILCLLIVGLILSKRR